MIVCINCNAETKAKMDSVLKKGHYKDYSELMAVAVDNLWMLEREVAEKGALVIGEGLATSLIPSVSALAEKFKPASIEKLVATPSSQINSAIVPFAPVEPYSVHIPKLFLAEGLDKLSCATVEVPLSENTLETFTLDRWLFGQYNKLLPAKANCRALVRLTAGQENGVPMDTTVTMITEAAALLGDYLANHDRLHKIGRDDTLATAFPRSDPDAEKSRCRYANQFVGSVNSQNVLSGLLCDYRLAGLTSEYKPRLLPTEQAINLARLTNPILDVCQNRPTQKFSSEEIIFLLDHIHSFVPVEAFAFHTLIQAITDGADTPDKLDETLQVLVPTDSKRSLSPSFLTSQRSGALSRMTDLRLITRARKGVRVLYAVTEQAQSFMDSK